MPLRRIPFFCLLILLSLAARGEVKYHPHDLGKIYAFLVTENQSGIPNWYRMNLVEMGSLEDPGRWIDNVPGVAWSDGDGSGRRLKHVDWSAYYVSGRLDLSGCTQLEELYCQNNSLETVDASNCISLRILHCQQNVYKSSVLNGAGEIYDLSSLAKLDVSGCVNLEELKCHDNYLSELDVAGLGRLKELDCSGNRLLFSKLPHPRSLPAGARYGYSPQRYVHPAAATSPGAEVDLSPLVTPGFATTLYINEKAYPLASGGLFRLPVSVFPEVYLLAENALFPGFSHDKRLVYIIKLSGVPE